MNIGVLVLFQVIIIIVFSFAGLPSPIPEVQEMLATWLIPAITFGEVAVASAFVFITYHIKIAFRRLKDKKRYPEGFVLWSTFYYIILIQMSVDAHWYITAGFLGYAGIATVNYMWKFNKLFDAHYRVAK